MPALGYSAITKPHLWHTDTVQEARLECIKKLQSTRLKPATRQAFTDLQTATEKILADRNVRPRPNFR